ncbi:hypothetical protein Hanom_Chr02g00130611 [Helianthus anomalus]
MNPLDENFQLKNPMKRSDRYVMELGSSHYDLVGNKSKVTNWRYDYDKNMWLINRESGQREYYAKESQFQTWTKIDFQSLLHIMTQIQLKEAVDGRFMLSSKRK